MTAYILKTVFCAAIFLAFYLLVLEREKMHRFNRYYLLLSFLLSFCIPLISVELNPEYLPIENSSGIFISELPVGVIEDKQAITNNVGETADLFLWCYLTVTFLLLCRFLKNLVSIYLVRRISKTIPYEGVKLILVDKQVAAHSFLNYIFISRHDYENGKVEQEILLHELAHVKQRHSLDILLLEWAAVFAWVNPLVFFFIKAVEVNHEYLADDAVVRCVGNKSDYQFLLINKTRHSDPFGLASKFNFQITKKRLFMMTKSTRPAVAILKQVASLPLLVLVIFLFSSRTIAQKNTEQKSSEKKDTAMPGTAKPLPYDKHKLQDRIWVGQFAKTGPNREGVSEELMKEYATIEKKYIAAEDSSLRKEVEVTDADHDRLEEIFLQMSHEQQLLQRIVFLRPTPPLPRIRPTEKEFEAFKNPAVYGVWLDRKKVNNQVLSKYTRMDISHVFISKLYRAAKANKNYVYQVDLLTNEVFEADNKKTREHMKNHMVFRGFRQRPAQ